FNNQWIKTMNRVIHRMSFAVVDKSAKCFVAQGALAWNPQDSHGILSHYISYSLWIAKDYGSHT
ncbi:hypothetical protein, partial [Vibrio sp. V07_P2A8T137]